MTAAEPFDAAELDALADRIWGEGQWVRCPICPDSFNLPSRHHWRAHEEQEQERGPGAVRW